MYYYLLKDSTRTDKKFMVQYINPSSGVMGKIVHFGAKKNGIPYSDYTIHKDPDRKARYIARHQKNEDWSDLNRAGAWSRWLLWNEPTLHDSIKDMEKRFNIKIVLDYA